MLVFEEEEIFFPKKNQEERKKFCKGMFNEAFRETNRDKDS